MTMMLTGEQILYPVPPWEAKIGDRVKCSKGTILPLIGKTGVIVEVLRPCVVVVEVEGQTYHLWLPNLERAELNAGARLWHEARMRHFERVIPRLAKNLLHCQLVRSMQAEYESILQQLGINDEEVEF